jgi:hypothetical protein
MIRFDRLAKACVVVAVPASRSHRARRLYARHEAMPHHRLSAALNAELQLDRVYRTQRPKRRSPPKLYAIDIETHDIDEPTARREPRLKLVMPPSLGWTQTHTPLPRLADLLDEQRRSATR